MWLAYHIAAMVGNKSYPALLSYGHMEIALTQYAENITHNDLIQISWNPKFYNRVHESCYRAIPSHLHSVSLSDKIVLSSHLR
jgi:hypothetical protein